MKTYEADVAVATPGKENQISTFIVPPPDRRSVRGVVAELKKRKVATAIGAAALVVVLGLIAFKHAGKAAAPAPGPVPVTVQTLTESHVQLWSEFSGRMNAVNYAEIRPEVSGRITEVRIRDGQTVDKGDVLFVIDPAPFEATMAKAEANAVFAKTELDRAAGLVKAQAIAQRLYDERQSASLAAEADLARAKVDVDRAYVKAPISGRVGRAEITVGNFVQTTPNAPLLTSIVSNNGIYADFEVDEQTYLESVRGHADSRAEERDIPVELMVQGDKARTYKGKIYSFDNHIDNVSGTIRARAKFPNRDGALVPGMFVSVKIGSNVDAPVLLVPERALGLDQSKKFVYVVGKDNKVAYHEVVLGKQVGSDRVALSGVQAGDRIIVDGLQHVRPEMIVDPKELTVAAR